MRKEMTPEEFFGGNEVRVDIFKKKYMKNKTDSVNQCFRNICDEITSVSIEKEKEKWNERWVDELMDDMWRPGGSIIASTNNPTKKISVFNCTTVGIPDDTLESIYTARYQAAKLAAYRQGLGLDFSNLRPKGVPVNNSAEVSEGSVHWMRSFNNIGKEVGQRGRIPAILGSLMVRHPDAPELITAKDVKGEIENMNLSLQITDDFIDAVNSNSEWKFEFEPNKTFEFPTVSATQLFRDICHHAWISGDPGLQFIDKMKRWSIQEALGEVIISTNACSEKPLVHLGVCGLASANLGKVPAIDSPKFIPYIKRLAESMVRFMDNVAQYEIENNHKSPLSEQLEAVKRLREIGIGVTNIHQWLYDQGMAYDSKEGADAIEYFFKHFFYHCFMSSADLAVARGACPAWEKTKAEERLAELETPFLTQIFGEFPDLRDVWYKIGLRNAALLSIAPTGSLSMTFKDECLSWGIEPTIAWCYWRKTRALTHGTYECYFVLPDSVKKIVLSEMSKTTNVPDADRIAIEMFPGSMKDEDGSIGQRIQSIVKKYANTKILKSALDIDPFQKIDLMSRVQKWVDSAISVTYNVPNSFSVADVEKLFMMAYDANLKSLTIFREGTREGILLFDFPENLKMDIKKELANIQDGLNRPTDIVYNYSPKRPSVLPAERYKVLKHHVVVGLLNGKPYEVFIVEHDGDLPKNGFILKKSKRRYIYLDVDGKEFINLIDKEVINDEIKAITRLVSSNLRHGVPIDFICAQLKKCGDIINAYPKMLGRVLEKYKFLMVEEEKFSGDVCEQCGQPLMDYDGCVKCLNPECNFSKCG